MTATGRASLSNIDREHSPQYTRILQSTTFATCRPPLRNCTIFIPARASRAQPEQELVLPEARLGGITI